MSQNRFLDTAATLVNRGYSIIPLAFGAKRPIGDAWVNTRTTVESLATWPERGNIGILAEHTPAIDLDILDGEFVELFAEWISEHVGAAPMRVGLAPKVLLVFRAVEPFRKVASRFWQDDAGRTHRVEVLGKGQQFVAFGMHPDTKKPYRWITDDDPRNTPVDDLPLLDAETATRVIVEFERRAAAMGWTPKGLAAQAPAGGEDDDLAFLRPKPDVTEDELREVIELFDNPGRDYELWVRVGMALHHQTDGGADGLELWHAWSSRSALYDSGAVDSKWESFGRYTGRKVTIAFMLAATSDARKARVRAHHTETTRDARGAIRAAIAAAADGDALLDTVLGQIADVRLDSASEQILLAEVAVRHKALTGAKPSVRSLARTVNEIRSKSRKVSPLEVLRLEYNLAGQVLEEHWESGATIKRFSKLWWTYTNGVWRRAEEDAIKARVQETLIAMMQADDESVRTLLANTIDSRGDRLSAIVGTIYTTLERRVAEDGADDPLGLSADRVAMVVNCQNVELWFKDTGEMKVARHNPRHLLTNQVGCAYDAQAQCPTWDAAIRKVFKSCVDPEDVIRHFEEVMGYILQPTRHQAVWVMLKGPGGNGKSFLLAVMSSLMGAQTVIGASIAEMAQGVSPHFTDSLQGKLMLLDDDQKAKTLLPDDWLKKLSEAKLITANPKFGRPYNFTARSIPVILTNSWPSTVDLSDGLRRRALVFESNHVLTQDEKDPKHFRQIVDHELPGVLNRFVAGFRRFLARGQRFDIPAECRASSEDWLALSNPTAQFARQALETTDDRRDHVPASRIYDAYFNWVRHWEHGIRVLGRYQFYEALAKLGYRRVNHHNVVVFSGIRLRATEGLEGLFFDGDPNQGL